jgi:metal-responsive CopG/Arc/MetJ family transcriptional regulator
MAMKTAVSLPDDLFRSAEAAARKLRVSRSELYAAAIREFLDRRRSDSITAQLNEIYSKQDSSLDPALYLAQIKSLEKDSW